MGCKRSRVRISPARPFFHGECAVDRHLRRPIRKTRQKRDFSCLATPIITAYPATRLIRMGTRAGPATIRPVPSRRTAGPAALGFWTEPGAPAETPRPAPMVLAAGGEMAVPTEGMAATEGLAPARVRV